jgi:XTP/dITP diphosphohydrolase
MKNILIASGNAHKVSEIRKILHGLPCNVLSLKDIHNTVSEPEETGLTFGANAFIKASAYKGIFSEWILADDSGIVVPALDGEPGIYSARYAGVGASDADNRQKLQAKVRELGGHIEAYFVCALSLLIPNSEPKSFEAHWNGHVMDDDRGENGFGYDSMFIPLNETRTSAQMSEGEKNEVSHRAQALRQFRTYVEKKL